MPSKLATPACEARRSNVNARSMTSFAYASLITGTVAIIGRFFEDTFNSGFPVLCQKKARLQELRCPTGVCASEKILLGFAPSTE